MNCTPQSRHEIKNQFKESDIIHFRKEVYFIMAKKGQKFQKYTQEEKEKVLKEYLNGISSTCLSKKHNIPKGTIKTWSMKVYHPELNTGNKKGRPKESNLTKEDWKERYEILKKYQAFLKAQRERK